MLGLSQKQTCLLRHGVSNKGKSFITSAPDKNRNFKITKNGSQHNILFTAVIETVGV